MKRIMIIGGGIVAVAIVAIVVAVVFLASNLDSLVKTAVEEIGTRATGAEVTLDSVALSPTTGQGALDGLTVGNPPGFKTDHAFRLGSVSLAVDVASITSDTVVVKEVVVTQPQVTYELGGSGSNVDALKKNVESFVNSTAGGGSGGSGGGDGAGGKKVVIENLYIRDGKVGVSASFLQGKALSAPLPDIHLKDIGKDKGGATPAEVAQKVVGAITGGAGKAVASLGLGDMAKKAMEGAAGAAGAVKDGASGLVSGAAQGAGAATEAIGQGAENVGGAVKKLFGK
jgi:hypothetical protein